MNKRFIFKDEVCDAVYEAPTADTFKVVCCKGVLAVNGSVEEQFKAFHQRCNGCGRIRIVDRAELELAFKNLSEKMVEVLKEDGY